MNDLSQRIEPFRALIYGERFRPALAQVVAPPYDLIGPARQDELYARSPDNIIRLELNRDPDRYAASAAMLAHWLREGVLVRYPRPAIYFYTQRFEVEGRRFTRHGLVARIRLQEFSSGRILPHEKTFPAAKEDRLKLLAATRTNTSSIFGLYSADRANLAALNALSERALERPPLMSVSDDLGTENEIRPLDAPADIRTVQSALADPRVLIADGHHRYETALNYRRERRAAEGNPPAPKPYDYTMMTLTATRDPGLVILPTHRVVKRLPKQAAATFAAAAGESFEIREFADLAALLAALRAAGPGTIAAALAHDSSFRLLALKDPAILAAAMPGEAPEVRRLDVSILHALILDRIFGLKPEQVRAGGLIEYTVDARAALEAVIRSGADGAFLMNPPSIAEVERVSAAGATMPEKSTYFQPKLLTGLVLNPLDDDL